MSLLKGIDSVEFAVKDLSKGEKLSKAWGFQKVGEGQTANGLSVLYAQGNAKLVFTKGLDDKSYAKQWVDKHGDGICDLVMSADNVEAALQQAAKAGGRIVRDFKKEEVGGGTISKGSLRVFGDVTFTFLKREGTKAFAKVLETDVTVAPKGFGIKGIDHLTNNVNMGEMDALAEFYIKGLGFVETRFFRITTGRTGLVSKVMQTPDGAIKVPINEPTEPESQVQEFNDLNGGPGVQHLAYLCADINETLNAMRGQGEKFLTVPDTYYEAVPSRVSNLKHDLRKLRDQMILVDGDDRGYILQLFSQNVMGPFFYELIQRCGNDGFGEGNFKALFEAIERDQIARGVLKTKKEA